MGTHQNQVVGCRGRGQSAEAWLAVSLALLLGALIVLGASTFLLLGGDRYEHKLTRVWQGTDLAPLTGHPTYSQDGLVLPPFSPRQRIGVELPHRGLSAGRYASLQVHSSGHNQRLRLEFVWLDDDVPGNVRSIWPPAVPDGVQTIDLNPQAGWRGDVGRLFLYVHGSLSDTVILHSVRLQPIRPTAGTLLRQILEDWTALEGWRGHSINFILGGANRPLIPLVPAVFAWLALSMALYALWLLIRGHGFCLTPFAIIFLTGWLALDLRWQSDLLRQLQITRAQYAGTDYHEKRLASDDRDLYRFAQQVKDRLPPSARRLFLIVPTTLQGNNYLRTRLHYLLLPQNVGSLWSMPPAPEHAADGDFLLILRPHPQVSYTHQTGHLHWDDTLELPVERLMTHPMGDLYRVRR